MPAKSSPQTFSSKLPIVVVPAKDSRLIFSTLPDPDFEAFDRNDALKLKKEGVVAIWKDTTIEFHFNGTGIAVVGLPRKPYPPVPKTLLPIFNCMVDGLPAGPPDMDGKSDIPADGKILMCRKTKLQANQNHTLIVNVTVSRIPAFFDSVRFRPIPPDGSGAINLDNTTLRIDSQDTNHIKFDNRSWGYAQRGHRVSSKRGRRSAGGFMNITIPSARVQNVAWFGDVDHLDDDHDFPSTVVSLPVILDGNQTQVPLTLPSSGQLFNLTLNGSSSQVQISIPAPDQYQLSLDHLMVTLGQPKLQQLTGIYNHTNRGKPEAAHRVSPAIPIVGGIFGSLFIILVTFIIARWVENRRRRRHIWKDSALPPAIRHPGTRISSRSSFSREVVTGDIEYNPEAQKKLEGAFNAGVIEPPQALILHTDSGYRGFNASEVPPHYTRM